MAKSAAQLDREIAGALLTNRDGTRNALGRALVSIARMGNAGFPVDRSDVTKLIEAGYVIYGLHPMGGYRANITSAGRNALGSV